MPGVAYVAVDGIPDPVRVRFAWHSDEHIAQLVTRTAGTESGLTANLPVVRLAHTEPAAA